MLSAASRIWSLLRTADRRGAVLLLGLMTVGMLVETIGIGLVVPAIAILLNDDLAATYPQLASLLERLGNPDRGELIVAGMLAIVVVYLARTLFLAYLAWRQAGFAYGMQAHLSERLLRSYLRQPYTFHLQRNSAELIRNATREVEFFTLYCLLNVLVIASEGLVMLGITVLLLGIEPVGTLTVAVIMGLAAGSFGGATRTRLGRWGRARQTHDGLRLQHLQQGLGGAKEVILLGREQEFINQYGLHNSASAALAQRQATVAQLPRLWLELVAVSGLAVLIVTLVLQGRTTATLLPSLGLFAAAGFRFLPSVNRVITAVQGFRYGRPTIDVLEQELQLAAAPASDQRSAGARVLSRELRLTDVTYVYPGARAAALQDVSMCVRCGECLGIIGSSGAGKSTLVDVCLGLLVPTSGIVTLDGADIRENLRAWQKQIGYVSQTFYLTDDTIRRNIAFGLPDGRIDEDAVWTAVRDAQLESFVRSLPAGLDTIVGERGVALSGGQRQRIGIARALYDDPPVLVLDEATSGLDVDTEQGVLRAVYELQGRKTVVIVTHRTSTLAVCDRVLRLKAGRIVAEGPAEAVLTMSVD